MEHSSGANGQSFGRFRAYLRRLGEAGLAIGAR